MNFIQNAIDAAVATERANADVRVANERANWEAYCMNRASELGSRLRVAEQAIQDGLHDRRRLMDQVRKLHERKFPNCECGLPKEAAPPPGHPGNYKWTDPEPKVAEIKTEWVAAKKPYATPELREVSPNVAEFLGLLLVFDPEALPPNKPGCPRVHLRIYEQGRFLIDVG
jgi:hypothetical protein